MDTGPPAGTDGNSRAIKGLGRECLGSGFVMAMVADGHVLDDRYRLDRWVTSGGFGDVWQATDVVLSRPVAVRLLCADESADPEALARFRVEARRASSVTHQNVARVFDYNDAVAGQPPFLVTEFVDGRSLADLLTDGPLTVPVTLSIVAQVAAGIAAANEAGLVHLDVKPANVVLSADGAVKITDLGIGSAASSADLYPLGMLAHECLRAEPPITGTSRPGAASHQVDDLPSLPTGIPDAVAELIMELTDKDPANRPQSAAAVAKRASALREQLEPSAPAQPPVDAFVPQVSDQTLVLRPARRRLLLVPVALVVAVVSAFLLASHLDEHVLPAQNAIQAGHPTAEVHGAAFKNLPVRVAGRRLRRLGFTVRTRWRRSATVPAGLVISVSPTGRLPLGSIVTVLGSRPAGGPGRVAGSRSPTPAGKPSHSPRTTTSPSPRPTPTPTPSPTGTPSPTPSQSPTSNPTPTGSPTSAGNPSPTDSASPAPSPAGRPKSTDHRRR